MLAPSTNPTAAHRARQRVWVTPQSSCHGQTMAVPWEERLFTLQSSREGSIRCLVLR